MEFTNDLDFAGLNDDVDGVLPSALREAGELIKTASLALAPRDTGHLHSTAGVDMVDNTTVAVSYSAVYARYLEFGIFWRMRPHPSPHNGKPLMYHHGGGPFFLTTPMRTEAEPALGLIANRIKGIL